jgi:hypothetical protein
VAATGENQWPPPGSPVTVYGEDLMAADKAVKPEGDRCSVDMPPGTR